MSSSSTYFGDESWLELPSRLAQGERERLLVPERDSSRRQLPLLLAGEHAGGMLAAGGDDAEAGAWERLGLGLLGFCSLGTRIWWRSNPARIRK